MASGDVVRGDEDVNLFHLRCQKDAGSRAGDSGSAPLLRCGIYLLRFVFSAYHECTSRQPLPSLLADQLSVIRTHAGLEHASARSGGVSVSRGLDPEMFPREHLLPSVRVYLHFGNFLPRLSHCLVPVAVRACSEKKGHFSSRGKGVGSVIARRLFSACENGRHARNHPSANERCCGGMLRGNGSRRVEKAFSLQRSR